MLGGVDWTSTLLDGLVGSCVAVVGTFVAALLVFSKQSKSDRNHFEQERKDANDRYEQQRKDDRTKYEQQLEDDRAKFEDEQKRQWQLYEQSRKDNLEADLRSRREERRWGALTLGQNEVQQTIALGQQCIVAPDERQARLKWVEMLNALN